MEEVKQIFLVIDQGQLYLHTLHMVANVDHYTNQVSPLYPCRRKKKQKKEIHDPAKSVSGVRSSCNQLNISFISSQQNQVKEVLALLLVNFAVTSPLCHLPR